MGNKDFVKVLGVALVISTFASCGGASFGDTDGAGSGGGGGGGGGTVTPASIKLVPSASTLPSSATTSTSAGAVVLTAIVKDANNNLLSGIPVSFSSKKSDASSCGGGGAVTGGGTTDASGTVTSTLTTAGDQQNQIITVTATAGGKSDSVDIPVVGTHLQVTGPTSLGSGSLGSYAFSLLDSSNNGIPNQAVTITSCPSSSGCSAGSPANTLSSGSIDTDAAGKGTVTYTGTNGGTDILRFASSCATPTTVSVVVSSRSLAFTSPDPASATVKTVPFDTAQKLVVKLVQGTTPQAGQVIKFTSTRGTLLADAASVGFTAGSVSSQATVTTDGSGLATLDIKQASGPDGVGSAIITATTVSAPIAAATANVQIVSTTPAQIDVQGSSSLLLPSGSVAVRAIVRDDNSNPVQDQRVDFSLTGIGSLAAAFGTTDSQGVVTTTYTAPTSSTGQNNVTVTGTVTSGPTTLSDAFNLTVGGQALNISIMGCSTTISSIESNTAYSWPCTLQVTDSAGQPVQNVTVTLKLADLTYLKGSLKNDPTEGWIYDTSSLSPVCDNEDANLNGILDAGEDINTNGVLDPGGVAAVSSPSGISQSITTDSTGFGNFIITYPKDVAYWATVRLTATVNVAGTESIGYSDRGLAVLVSDYGTANASVPGQTSPFGVNKSCSVAN